VVLVLVACEVVFLNEVRVELPVVAVATVVTVAVVVAVVVVLTT
jgi:hypothetical protein